MVPCPLLPWHPGLSLTSCFCCCCCFFNYIYLVGTCVQCYVDRGQRTIFRSRFFPSIMWVPRRDSGHLTHLTSLTSGPFLAPPPTHTHRIKFPGPLLSILSPLCFCTHHTTIWKAPFPTTYTSLEPTVSITYLGPLPLQGPRSTPTLS